MRTFNQFVESKLFEAQEPQPTVAGAPTNVPQLPPRAARTNIARLPPSKMRMPKITQMPLKGKPSQARGKIEWDVADLADLLYKVRRLKPIESLDDKSYDYVRNLIFELGDAVATVIKNHNAGGQSVVDAQYMNKMEDFAMQLSRYYEKIEPVDMVIDVISSLSNLGGEDQIQFVPT